MNLTNKTALITGSGQGSGQGATVVINDLIPLNRHKTLKGSLEPLRWQVGNRLLFSLIVQVHPRKYKK